MTNILVIDDDPAVLRMAIKMLAAEGYACVGCETAEAGLSALDAQAFDAVLTDIQMPGMSGKELILHIKATFPDLPVIAVSGSGPSHGQQALAYAERLGAAGVVGKPFTRAQLVDVMVSVLKGTLAPR